MWLVSKPSPWVRRENPDVLVGQARRFQAVVLRGLGSWGWTQEAKEGHREL